MKFDKYIIYSDMDSTAINSKGEISKKNLEKIKYFQENGGMFAFATGRQAEFFKKYDMAINAPIICMNGTVVFDFEKNEAIYKNPMDEKCAEIFDAVSEKYAEKMTGLFVFYENEVEKCFDLKNIPKFEEDIYKCVFVFLEERDALDFKAEMIEKYSLRYSFERSWPFGVEMTLKEAGKGACINYIKTVYKDRKIICMGDYENDMTMLAAADIPIAVANAIEPLKEIAKIIAPSCDEDAIAWVIDNIGTTII